MNSSHPAALHLDRYSGLELRHLRLIATVAEEHGLSRAARRLRLTPSALSHQLRAVERVVGGPVLHRRDGALRLTPAGDLLLETAGRVLRTLQDAEDRLGHLREGRTGTVRVSTHCFSGYHWLPSVMRSFRADFPAVDVRIVAEATTRAVEALKAGEIDLALTPESPANGSFAVRPVLRDEMMLVLAADHPLARRSWVEPHEIAREHLLAYATRPEQSALCLEILRPAGLAPRKATCIRLTEAMVEMVKAGLGVAALAEWAVEPYLASGTLVTRRITRRGWLRTWNAVTRNAAEAGAPVTTFVAHLAAEFGTRKKTLRLRGAKPPGPKRAGFSG